MVMKSTQNEPVMKNAWIESKRCICVLVGSTRDEGQIRCGRRLLNSCLLECLIRSGRSFFCLA